MLTAPPSSGDIALLVVSAGRGLRAGGGVPKQYRRIASRPLLAWTLQALSDACPESPIQCVIHPDDRELYESAVALLTPAAKARVAEPTDGGLTRQASVRLGLEALASVGAPRPFVLIHDAARPFITKRLIDAARAALATCDACAPGVPVTDAMKEIEADGRVIAEPERARLRAVQTPQAFGFESILSAHRSAVAAGVVDLPDDLAVAHLAGRPIWLFEGDAANVKITRPEDFAMAETRMADALQDVRTGQGFDVHAFAPGDKVWLGGVAIPFDRGLLGHSDADVLMHAVTDALFGAIADGDIGSHFPPSDPQWKGAASDIFLRKAVECVRARGGVISHVDGTIICEYPKVGPHRDAIRAKLADIMQISLDRVAIKATTSERLGFTGRGEGIAALAIATVRLPASPNDD